MFDRKSILITQRVFTQHAQIQWNSLKIHSIRASFLCLVNWQQYNILFVLSWIILLWFVNLNTNIFKLYIGFRALIYWEISTSHCLIVLVLDTRLILCRERVGTTNTFCNISSEKYSLLVSPSAQSLLSTYKSK